VHARGGAGAPADDAAASAALAEPAGGADSLVPVRVTIGVADLIPGVTDPAALLRRADQALYVAKQRGRNQVATIRDVDQADAEVTVPSALLDDPR